MSFLEVAIEGKTSRIEYSSKFADGMYFVDNNRKVLANCKLFDIEFEEAENECIVQIRITRIKNFVFLTQRSSGKYIQNVFFNTASEEDISDLGDQLGEPGKSNIQLAYQTLKVFPTRGMPKDFLKERE